MKTGTRLFASAAIGVLALAAARSASAHHSFSAVFDPDQPVTLHGKITGMDWINPHSWLYVEVENEDGTTTTWEIETATPNTLLRRGFARDTVEPGTEVTIHGFRARNGEPIANGRDMILSDGSRLFMGSRGTGAPGDDDAEAGAP